MARRSTLALAGAAGAALRAALCAALCAALASASPQSCLPLLPPGTLLGAAYGGSAVPASNAEFTALVAAGARLAQVSITWAALESPPGVIHGEVLADALLGARRLGLTPLVNIAAIDTNHAAVPSDLAHPTDPTSLAPGLTWSSAVVVDRMAVALQTLAPIAAYYGAVYVGVGNEVDANLALHPGTGYDFVVFADEMGGWVKNLTTPRMATGVTLTVGGILGWGAAPPAWFSTLTQVVDVTPLTYYPLTPAFVVKPPSVVAGELGAAVGALPPEWCVVLQELGYPSGYGNASSTDGSTPALQAAFFGAALDALGALNGTTNRVRAVSAFSFMDMDAATCAAFARYYNVTTPAFVEYLCTLGLVKGDGTPKPAYAELLARVGRWGRGRGG